jgi:hypothetical protein
MSKVVILLQMLTEITQTDTNRTVVVVQGSHLELSQMLNGCMKAHDQLREVVIICAGKVCAEDPAARQQFDEAFNTAAKLSARKHH